MPDFKVRPPVFSFTGRIRIELRAGASLNGQPVLTGLILKPTTRTSWCSSRKGSFTKIKYSLGTGHRESHLYTDSGNKIRNKLTRQVGDLIRQWQVFQFHETSQMRGTHYIMTI